MQNNQINNLTNATTGLLATSTPSSAVETSHVFLTPQGFMTPEDSLYSTPYSVSQDSMTPESSFCNTPTMTPRYSSHSLTVNLLFEAQSKLELLRIDGLIENAFSDYYAADVREASAALKSKFWFNQASVEQTFDRFLSFMVLNEIDHSSLISLPQFVSSFFTGDSAKFDAVWQDDTARSLEIFLTNAYPYIRFDSSEDQRSFIRFLSSLRCEGYQFLSENPLPNIEIVVVSRHCDDNVPSPRLVGIETNPGPTVNRNMQNFLLQNKNLYESNVIKFWIHYETSYRSMTYEAFCSEVVNDALFRKVVSKKTGIRKSTLVLIAFRGYNFEDEPTLFKRTDNGFLVCVEKNPGPCLLSTLAPPSLKRREFVPQGFLDFGVDPNTSAIFSKFVDSVQTIAENPSVFKVEHSVPLLDNLFSKFMNALPALSTCKTVAILFATVGVILYCKEKGMIFSVVVGLISTYVAVSYCDNLLNKAIEEIVSLMTSSDELEPQVGKESLLNAILGYIYFQAAGVAYDKNAIGTFLKTVGDMPKLRDGISFLLDYILECVQKFVDFLCDVGNFEKIQVKSTMFPEIDVLYKEVNKLISDLRDGAPYNYDNAMILFELEKKANNIFASIPNTREFSEYKRSAMNLLGLIKPLVSRMERNNITGNGPRREPLAMMFGGPSGVGKSTSIVPLMLAVNSLILPEEKLKGFVENHNDYIWNFIPENPFFDSYHGQFNTVIDEAGAYHDVAGTPDPGALGAIRMINTANFPLHMAHLEDKGNCNFTSELVWATTNRTFFDWKSMYLSEAYSRRFKVSYLHVPKAEFCKEGSITNNLWDRRLDNSKIPYHDDGFVMSINEFYPYDFIKGAVVGPPIGFDDLVKLIANTYVAHKAHGDKLLNFHSINKERYMAMRAEFQAQGGSDDVDDIARWFNLEPDFVYKCFKEEHRSFSVRCSNDLRDFWNVASQRLYALLPMEKLGEWYEEVKSFVLDHKFLLSLAAVIPIALGVWCLLRPVLFEQSGSVRRQRTKPSARPNRVAVLKASLTPQAGISQNCIDISLKVMSNNVYTLELACHKGLFKLGYLTFLAGRLALMPEHFAFTIDDKILFSECDANPVLVLRRVSSPSVGFDIQYEDVRLMAFDDCKNDITYLMFPRVVHNHADITKFILSEEELPNKFDGALLRNVNGCYTLVSTPVVCTGTVNYACYSTESSFTYKVSTKPGECGAFLMTSGSSQKPRICGMHIAGNGTMGTATSFPQHHIKAALSEATLEVIPRPNLDPPSVAQVGDRFVAVKEIKKLRTATKNQVVESPLHEAWGPSSYAPSLLRKIGDIDPWVNARAKYSCVSKAFNLHLLDSVTQDYCSELSYSVQSPPWDPRLFSFEEAVAGIPGVPFCEGIPRNTSSGYPFCLDIKLKGKKDYFGSEGDYEFSSRKCIELKEAIATSIDVLATGGRMEVMYADYLKDERRKKEKVVVGKTRLISASPLDFLIICRMYFGDFVRSIMSNRISNSCAIGINPFSFEWEILAKHLESVGTCQIFGDFSGFDGSLSQTLMYKTLDVVESFYSNSTEHDRRVRMGLFEDIVNSRHVTTGPTDNESTLYEWFGSNPSGNFLTTTLNSISNVIGIKYTIVNVFAKEAGFNHLSVPDSIIERAISSFPDNVRITTFGDDNGIGISDEFAKTVTQQSMTESFLDIGFVYTDEAKTGNVMASRVLQQCSFLKRGFKYDEKLKRHLAPLELEVILEMPYWTKTSALPETVHDTVDRALLELSLHDEAVFSKHAPILQRASIDKIGYCPNGNFRYNRAKALACEDRY